MRQPANTSEPFAKIVEEFVATKNNLTDTIAKLDALQAEADANPGLTSAQKAMARRKIQKLRRDLTAAITPSEPRPRIFKNLRDAVKAKTRRGLTMADPVLTIETITGLSDDDLHTLVEQAIAEMLLRDQEHDFMAIIAGVKGDTGTTTTITVPTSPE